MAEVMTHFPWSVFRSPVALMAKVFQDGTDWASTVLAQCLSCLVLLAV